MRWGRALAAFVALQAAQAAGYDDFTRGITANNRGDSDVAISSFSAALNAGDLVPTYVLLSYRGRARAYVQKGMCKEAAADLDAYSALKPLDNHGLFLRAGIKVCLKDGPGALRDFETASATDPGSEQYFSFGRFLWGSDQFPEAATVMLRAVDLMDPKGDHPAYVLLWYAVVADRIGKLDQGKFAKAADSLNSDWPWPLIQLFQGKGDVATVARKAISRDEKTNVGQKCEADFYTGEWHLVRGNTEAAKPLISSAVEHCPKNFIEYSAAQQEAKRLGLPVGKE